MTNRNELHELLCEALGSRQVYYQPPENVRMQYPCIVYHRDDIRNRHADNSVYRQTHHFQITVIDPSPDNPAIDYLSNLPRTTYHRHFVSDGLNHDVFTIYYWKGD